MAAVKGDVGKIMFENAGGTEADISGLRSWSLSITKDTQETTVLGNTSKSFVGGLISGEGSAELIYDPSGNSDYQAFIDDVLVTGDAGDALFELFPDSGTASKKIGFAGIVTSAEYGATLGEIQIINISFVTNGAITSAI
nr:phage major tail protein 2 [uncultured Mediterranean phage uvMED]